jgi:multimeric flavodoxin WrbA
MAKVLALLGSPRKAGNTDILLDAAFEPLAEAGHATQKIYVYNLEISPCRAHFTCQKHPETPGCDIEDDMLHVHDEVLAADLLLFATPVYMNGLSAQLKCVLDRMYALLKFSPDHAFARSLVQGQKWALLVTSGGDAFEGADLVVNQLRRMAGFAGCSWLGQFCAPMLTSPEKTRANALLLQRAQAFGRQLARKF